MFILAFTPNESEALDPNTLLPLTVKSVLTLTLFALIIHLASFKPKFKALLTGLIPVSTSDKNTKHS